MAGSRLRDERAVQEALQAVTGASLTALDAKIYQAAILGANYREIARAAGLAVSTVHQRALKYSKKVA
jgi:DNA-directed RNA polymerase specialized sigma24 family protein